MKYIREIKENNVSTTVILTTVIFSRIIFFYLCSIFFELSNPAMGSYIFISMYTHMYFECLATLDSRSYKFKCPYLKLESLKFIPWICGNVELWYFLTL